MITIIIAEDHQALIDGMKSFLKNEDDIQIADIDDFRKQKKVIKEKKKDEKERTPPVLSELKDEETKKRKPRKRDTAAPSPAEIEKSRIHKLSHTKTELQTLGHKVKSGKKIGSS